MRKLGKGLSELGLNELLRNSNRPASPPPSKEQLQQVSVDTISPGPHQPRQYMDETALNELADSIRAQGILQPIIVRARPGNRHEIIAGERRWRAAQIAGLDTVPVIVRDVSDQTAVAFALIENIQRHDLSAIEEANALQRLLEEFQLTHDAVAEAVGKSRATVTNLLRLLRLNPDVKTLLAEHKLDMGHARALLAVEGLAQSDLAQQIVKQGLSVRQTEALVRQKQMSQPAKSQPVLMQNTETLQRQKMLSEMLGANVSVRHNAKGKGKMIIHYHSLDELAGILEHIS